MDCAYFVLFILSVQRDIWVAIFVMRAPFLSRAPPFYMAHAQYNDDNFRWMESSELLFIFPSMDVNSNIPKLKNRL